MPINRAYSYHLEFFELTNIAQLVKILNETDSEDVVAGLRCISSLCVTCGESAYEQAQNELKSANCIEILLNLLSKNKNEMVKAEAAFALASICLDNSVNMKTLTELDPLFYSFIVILLNSIDPNVRLIATKSIGRFSISIIPQEDQILEQGALSYQFFKVFYFCFQNLFFFQIYF